MPFRIGGRVGIREFVDDKRTSILGKGAGGIGCGWVLLGQGSRP